MMFFILSLTAWQLQRFKYKHATLCQIRPWDPFLWWSFNDERRHSLLEAQK